LEVRAACASRRARCPRRELRIRKLVPANRFQEAAAIHSLKQTKHPFAVDVVFLQFVLELLPFERVSLAKVGDLELDDLLSVAAGDRPKPKRRVRFVRVETANSDFEEALWERVLLYSSRPNDGPRSVLRVLVPGRFLTALFCLD